MFIFKKDPILIIALLALPFNIRLLGVISISDIFLLLGTARHLLLGNIRVYRTNQWEIPVIILLTFLNLLGTLYWHNSASRIEGIVFVYKFAILYISLKIFFTGSILREDFARVNTLLSTYLSLYVFYYLFFKSFSGYYNIRVSFPFSDTTTTDSHLYGYVLGVLLISRLIVNKTPGFMELILNLTNGIALILTGSRTGLIFVILALFIAFRRVSKTTIVIIPIFMLVLMKISLDGDIATLVNRSLGIFNLFDGDQSANARLFKLNTALHESSQGFFFLPYSSVNSYALFYDNILLMILINYGITGILFAVLTLYIRLHKYKQIKGLVLYVIFILMINCITEYMLTTRGLLATIVGLGLIITNSTNYEDTSHNECMEIQIK